MLTITIPYLFRTPKGTNLWIKGPSNWVKDGIAPLDGIVESDWSTATFTMNWKLTRPDHSVRFEKGEPICMIVPMPRGLAEQLRPQRVPIEHNEELTAEFQDWREKRTAFNQSLEQLDDDAVQQGWQKDYFLGRETGGKRFDQHQTRLHIKEFAAG